MKMKKAILTGLIALLLGMTAVIPASASDDLPRLVDGADLLTVEEEKDLLARLDEISERVQADIVIVTATADQIGNREQPIDYAAQFYEQHGYGYGERHEGVIFLFPIGVVGPPILETSYVLDLYVDTDTAWDSLLESSPPDYAKACSILIDNCEEAFAWTGAGGQEAPSNGPVRRVILYIIAALAIGFSVAFLYKTGKK